MLQEQDAPRLEFEFQVTLKRVHRRHKAESDLSVPEQAHPLVRTLVLAHRIEAMIREGRIKDHAEASRSLGVSRPRIAQIAGLLLLAPRVQEAILDSSPERLAFLTVRQVRRIAAIPDWGKQAALWAKL